MIWVKWWISWEMAQGSKFWWPFGGYFYQHQHSVLLHVITSSCFKLPVWVAVERPVDSCWGRSYFPVMWPHPSPSSLWPPEWAVSLCVPSGLTIVVLWFKRAAWPCSENPAYDLGANMTPKRATEQKYKQKWSNKRVCELTAEEMIVGSAEKREVCRVFYCCCTDQPHFWKRKFCSNSLKDI